MFFTVEKIAKHLQEIRRSCDRQTIAIPYFKYWETDPKTQIGSAPGGPQQPDFDDQEWADFTVGQSWGGSDRLAWFRATLEIPEAWRDQRVFLRFDLGPRDGGDSVAEGLLYVDGAPLQAFDLGHEEAWLPGELLERGRLRVAIKAWSGLYKAPPHRRFLAAELVLKDPDAEAFFFLASTALAVLEQLPESDLARIRQLSLLNQAFHQIDFSQVKSDAYYQSISRALIFLRDGLASLRQADRRLNPKVTAIGHAHIDMAWLWRVGHTREKAARTFSTALHLMRQYPRYRFLHSSPQLYQFLKEDYPEIYAAVKERVRSGQWEVAGGMWVEADTNLTSGESLIRQFLAGRRFVRDEFGSAQDGGVEMHTLWLPDVFGYSAALPQIILKCGAKYFLTTKISWSQFNRFPHDTFMWRGIDGSEVLTHFVTTPEENRTQYTYNGDLSPIQVQGLWKTYRQKETNDELLTLFGLGDGGGGPTREMLERGLALQQVIGMPQVEFGKAEDFMAGLAERMQSQDLPVWDGELYLEYHRGTYTSQAANKRANRQAETLLQNVEWLSAVAEILGSSHAYPAEALRKLWETVLLLQFHDILPGSSIREVYEDSACDYAIIRQAGGQALDAAQAALAELVDTGEPAVIAFNPLARRRAGLCMLPCTPDIDRVLIPRSADGDTEIQLVQEQGRLHWLLQSDLVPAMGFAVTPLTNRADPSGGREAWLAAPMEKSLAPAPTVSRQMLENQFYRIRLNERGQITSLWDKSNQREVLALDAAGGAAGGNILQIFEDRPMNFDAWDIDLYYQEKMQVVDQLTSAQVIEIGPLRGVLRLAWKVGRSQIRQELVIYRDSRRIDFKTEIDWREQQTLLKTAFLVDVRATRATYEIQFGCVERPTHWNTSWDWARFEVCAQRWADLSEGNYGVALLNDCKYGYDIKDHQMRLTLVKSGIDPDPQADQGLHRFTYSLLPHTGDWRSGVIDEAQALNNPLLACFVPPGGEQPSQVRSSPALDLARSGFEFVHIDQDGVILETLKKAEDGVGWIVRFYEAHQIRHAQVRARFVLPLTRVEEVNMVEENATTAKWREHDLIFGIKPFEVKTFRLNFA